MHFIQDGVHHEREGCTDKQSDRKMYSISMWHDWVAGWKQGERYVFLKQKIITKTGFCLQPL